MGEERNEDNESSEKGQSRAVELDRLWMALCSSSDGSFSLIIFLLRVFNKCEIRTQESMCTTEDLQYTQHKQRRKAVNTEHAVS